MASKAFFSIEFKGGAQLIHQIADTELAMNELAKAIRNAKKAGDADNYKKLRKEQEDLKKSTADLKKELRDSVKEFEAQKYPIGSLAQLRQEYSKLTKEISIMTKAQRDSADGLAKIKFAANLKKEIIDIDQSIGNFTSNIGNYKSAFSGLAGILSGGLLGGSLVSVIGGVAQSVINVNKEISDAQSDVRKTTGLTNDEVEGLSNSLEKLDTRTSTAGLLQISVIAGQLGLKGQENIFKFTRAIDKLSVALGDEFGSVDEVADKTGRLSNIFFGVTDDADVLEKRLLSIGNALNGLSAEGSATAPIITEFASRIGRSLIPLGVAPAKVLALSSAFQELNINPEQGATAINNLIKDIGANIGLFSKTLAINKVDLETAFNTDPLEAFNLVLNKVNELSGGSSTKTLSLLKDLKQTGEGVSSVFLQLSSNSELYEKRLASANKLLLSNQSINDEYAVKNESAAASVEKVTKSFNDLLSSEGFRGFISFLAESVKKNIEVLILAFDGAGEAIKRFTNGSLFASEAQNILIQTSNDLTSSLIKEETNLKQNISTLQSATSSREAKTKAIEELNSKYPELFANYDLEYASVETLNVLQAQATEILRKQVFERVRLRGQELLIQKEIELAEKEALTRSGGGNVVQKSFANTIGFIFGEEKRLESLKGAGDILKAERDEVIEEQRKYNENTIELAKSLGVDLASQEKVNVDTFAQIGTQVKSASKQIQDAVLKSRSESNDKAVEKLVNLKKELDDVYSQVDKTDKQQELDLYLKRVIAIKGEIASITGKQVAGNTTPDKSLPTESNAADKKIKDANDKYIDEQQKRIEQNQKAILDLSIESINNIYDKEIAQNKKKANEATEKLIEQEKILQAKIKSQKGISTEKDKLESELIKSETKAITDQLEIQRIEVEKKRQEAFEKTRFQLLKLQSENNKAIENLAKQSISNNISDIKTDAGFQTSEIQLKYTTDLNSLKESLASGQITQIEFNRLSKELANNLSTDKLAIEKETSEKILNEQKRLLEAIKKINEAEQTSSFLQIDEKYEDDVDKALDDYKKGTIKTEAELDDIIAGLQDKRNTDKQAIIDANKQREIDAANAVKNAQLDADKAVLDSNEQLNDKAIEDAENRKKRLEELRVAALDTAQLLSDSIFALEFQRNENLKNKELESLDLAYEKKLEKAQGNATLEAALKDELEKKKLEIEKKAFEKQKKLQVAQALINAAVAATAIFTVPDFTFGIATAAKLAALAITTATSIAQIKRQEFADSGKVLPETKAGILRNRPNAPTTRKGDNVLIYAKPGEMMLNEGHQEAAQRVWPTIWQDLGVPGFADGGRVRLAGSQQPNITGIGRTPNYTTNVTISDEQMFMFAQMVAAANYGAVKDGAKEGSLEGTYFGNNEAVRAKERQAALDINTTF